MTTKTKPKTRKGKLKPREPKSWDGRVIRRQLAVTRAHFDETARAFEIRQDIRDRKRNRRHRPHLKALRLQRQAELKIETERQRRAAQRKRDALGRFKPKLRRAVKPSRSLKAP